MLRPIVLTTAVAAALLTAPAYGSIAPDDGWDTEGTTTVKTACASGTFERGSSVVGYGGRLFEVHKCSGGNVRVTALGNDGKPDPGFGTSGRLDMKLPAACREAGPVAVATKAGGLYLALEVFPGPDPVVNDLNLCIARITANGVLDTSFGGSSAFRRLIRSDGGHNGLSGMAVDATGRLLVFSERSISSGHPPAIFLHRLTTGGKPDLSFSGDGQRAYTRPHQGRVLFGGAVGNSPVLAFESYVGTTSRSGLGAVVLARFGPGGNLDPAFGSDGLRTIRPRDYDGAYPSMGMIELDALGRILIAVEKRSGTDGRVSWVDLIRVTKSGTDDTAFNAATSKVNPTNGNALEIDPSLHVLGGHPTLRWTLITSDFDTSLRITGWNADGTRWTAIGPKGTAPAETFFFARDLPVFYWIEFPGRLGEAGVDVFRSVVQ